MIHSLLIVSLSRTNTHIHRRIILRRGGEVIYRHRKALRKYPGRTESSCDTSSQLSWCSDAFQRSKRLNRKPLVSSSAGKLPVLSARFFHSGDRQRMSLQWRVMERPIQQLQTQWSLKWSLRPPVAWCTVMLQWLEAVHGPSSNPAELQTVFLSALPLCHNQKNVKHNNKCNRYTQHISALIYCTNILTVLGFSSDCLPLSLLLIGAEILCPEGRN